MSLSFLKERMGRGLWFHIAVHLGRGRPHFTGRLRAQFARPTALLLRRLRGRRGFIRRPAALGRRRLYRRQAGGCLWIKQLGKFQVNQSRCKMRSSATSNIKTMSTHGIMRARSVFITGDCRRPVRDGATAPTARRRRRRFRIR